MKRFNILALAFAGLFALASPAFAGGNELMYQKIQQLNTLAPSGIDAAADYVPVYDASAGTTKKVLAVNLASAKPIVSLAVDTALDATYCGKNVVMGGAGSSRTFTLPAATATGCSITFIVGAVNTSNYVITHAGSDVINGSVLEASDNAANAALAFEATAAIVTMTLNGTTKGGASIGDRVTFVDCVTGKWCVNGETTETGSEVTPWS